MNQDRWKTVNQIFHAALEVSSSERDAFVICASNGDRDLQAEVEILIKADQDAGDYLESPLMLPDLLLGSNPSLNSGDVLCERFHILRTVGEGGMGHVFEAYDSELAVHVALKVIRSEIASNPETLTRFRQEVRLARQITHPNVCRTFDLERETRDINGVRNGKQEVVFLTMEFLEGETLASRIKRTGPIPLDDAIQLARQVVDALAAAHAVGIVHRDMKPANIMLVPTTSWTGQASRAVITDFGLARPDIALTQGDHSALTHSGRPIGTLSYMAPEQLEGKTVSAATDIYALGLILFEMATGRRAFPSEQFLSGIARRLTGPPPSPKTVAPGLPIEWCRAIDGCLRLEPEDRFQSVADAISVLNGGPNGVLRLVNPQSIKKNTVGSWLLEHRFTALSRTLQKRPRWTAIAITAAMLAALVAGGSYFRSHHNEGLSDKDTVVLADFSNSTGEAVFDDALKTALMVSLNQSPFLNVLPESKVSETLKLMDRSPKTQITSGLASEICERAGGKAYISGAIGLLGSEYIVGLKAVNCQSGDVLAQEQVSANGKEKVLEALGNAASSLRRKLGESLVSVQKFDVSLADATTPSLDALKALSLGRRAYLHDTGAAERYFQEAIELDPNFAMAYHDLGRLYFTLNEPERGRGSFAKAFELRNHASEREKLEITATYYENVTGELENALNTRKQQVSSYPRIPEAYDGLAYVNTLLGKNEIAIAELRQSIQLYPDNADTYGLLAYALIGEGHLDEGRNAIQQAHARNVDAFLIHCAHYGLGFLNRDASAKLEEEQWMRNQLQYENFGLSIASDSEAYAGHLRSARQFTQISVNSAINVDAKETGAVWYENAALREAGFGNLQEAERAAANGMKLAPTSLGATVEAALAYAIAGDNVRAESLVSDLNRRFPLDTHVRAIWIPAVEAQEALNRSKPLSAIENLQASIPFEFGEIPFNTNESCLFPNYIRGEAYLAAKEGKLAAEEFQKIIEHNGMVWNCWTGALAHLGVARANALQASSSYGVDADLARTRAIAAYKDFLNLWKDADLQIPVFKQAESEYAKLNQQGK